jgi:glycosyltransferase involved in cell wall biosynthesis
VYSWPTAFLYTGAANREYYVTFDVEPGRLCHSPHTIDVARFAEPADTYEREAAEWRRQLGIDDRHRVLLFAGKFEPKKRPLELMQAVKALGGPELVLVLVGGGELEGEVKAIAARDPERYRVLPFQNQTRMPVAYRLGHVVVLPSAFTETWGLSVNEAMACGRPVVVSDRVGCAADVVDDTCGRVFQWNALSVMMERVNELTGSGERLDQMGRAAAGRAWDFDLARGEADLIGCLRRLGVL